MPLLFISSSSANLFTFYMICCRNCGMADTAIIYLSCLGHHWTPSTWCQDYQADLRGAIILVSHLASMPIGWINVMTLKNFTIEGKNVTLPWCHYRGHIYSTVLVWVTTFLSGGIPIILVIIFNSVIGQHLISASRWLTKEEWWVMQGWSTKGMVRRTIFLLGTVSLTFAVLSLPRFVAYCILHTKYNHDWFDRKDYKRETGL